MIDYRELLKKYMVLTAEDSYEFIKYIPQNDISQEEADELRACAKEVKTRLEQQYRNLIWDKD